MKILIVDNDTTGRGNIADFFHKKGYDIFQSTTVTRATGIVQLHPISIILCFNRHQDIDCLSLCRDIRDLKKERYIYFIVITKKDGKAEKIQGLKQGIDAFVTCPVDLEKLEALVLAGMRIAGFNSSKDKHRTSKQSKAILQLPVSPNKTENSSSKIYLNPEPGKKTGLKKEVISKYDILFVRVALDMELVSKEQLVTAFSFQKRQRKSGVKISIDDILVDQRVITKEECDNIRFELKGLETQKSQVSEQKILNKQSDLDLAAIEMIIKEIETISEEKHAIIKWSKEEKGIPVINVSGLIRQGTKLFGIHSSTLIRETIHNVLIKEIQQVENNVWTMKIFESK